MTFNLLKIGTLFAFLAFILGYGCGGSKLSKNYKEIAEIHKPIVLEDTEGSKRPDWTNSTTFSEDDQGFHFSGGVIGGADYALTLRMAKAEAIKNLLESIEIKARSEFSSVMHGSNSLESDIGRYVTDAVAWTIDNLRVRGIKQREIYYERVFDPSQQAVKYNAWVRLEIVKADYFKAKVDAAKRLLSKTIRENDKEAKQKAEELLENLRTGA